MRVTVDVDDLVPALGRDRGRGGRRSAEPAADVRTRPALRLDRARSRGVVARPARAPASRRRSRRSPLPRRRRPGRPRQGHRSSTAWGRARCATRSATQAADHPLVVGAARRARRGRRRGDDRRAARPSGSGSGAAAASGGFRPAPSRRRAAGVGHRRVEQRIADRRSPAGGASGHFFVGANGAPHDRPNGRERAVVEVRGPRALRAAADAGARGPPAAPQLRLAFCQVGKFASTSARSKKPARDLRPDAAVLPEQARSPRRSRARPGSSPLGRDGALDEQLLDRLLRERPGLEAR